MYLAIAELLSKDTPSATDEVITSLGKFYELLQFIGTMNTPVVAIMDGIISKRRLIIEFTLLTNYLSHSGRWIRFDRPSSF